jgi:hypothetical protein
MAYALMECCLIDREYYPLDMVAKLLEVGESDLVHFAANEKMTIHLLTDGSTWTYESFSEKKVLLPRIVPVSTSYWIELEAGFDNPSFYLTVLDQNDGELMKYLSRPFFNCIGSEITCNKLVVLHNELMKVVKKPFKSNTVDDLPESERNTMLKLIIGMAIDAYGYDPESTRNNLTGTNKNSLSAKLARKGITITDDTIRKYLTEAKNIL